MNKKILPRLFTILAFGVIWLGVFPTTVHAWGSKGHQIIARIARQRLSARARKAVNDLLKGQTLELASTWADQQRASQQFHFVAIPSNSNSYDQARHCADGNCLIEKIRYYREILQNSKETTVKRAEALRYILHLVGDLHQPFHCTDQDGNRTRVTFDKRGSSLHNVWDSDMIEKARMTVEQYARTLENSAEMAQAGYISRGTLVDWALESHAIARRVSVSSGELGDKYYQDNKWVLDGQLRKAGVRLADILNDVFR